MHLSYSSTFSFSTFIVVPALGTAPTQSERTSVLKFASSTFDRKETAIHDLEIEAGVVDTLSQHLKRVLDEDGCTKEAERTCKLISLVYQCSDERAAQSYSKVGTILIPGAFRMMAATGTESKYADRLLQRLSGVEVSVQSMENHKDILTLLLEKVKGPEQENNSTINHALSLLAGLATHQDSKSTLMKFPGLFEALVHVANNSKVEETKYQSARVLNKLAWNVKNRAVMARTKKYVDALIVSSTLTHENLQLEALTGLHLLAIECDNKVKLVTSSKGKLVPSLMSLIGTHTAEKIRLPALNALLNLISRETVKSIAFQEGLIDVVALMATSPKDEQPDEVASLAAQCIKRLAAYVQVKDKCHEGLLRAIIQMSHCEKKTVKHWAANAFLAHSAMSSNSFYIVRDQDALKSLAYLIGCPQREVKEPALETMVNLSENRSSAKKLAANNDLMAALVKCIDEQHGDFDNTILRRHAVRAILSLVSHRSSTKRIAKHLGLVAALSRYGIASSDTDVELKRAALHGVIILAPFL